MPMKTASAYLGCGIVKYYIPTNGQGISVENMWQLIEDFGINEDGFRKLQPTYKELFEIYFAVKTYKISVTYLRNLKKN